MPDVDFIRAEIERMRIRVGRQRKEILQLQRAGIPTTPAEALLQRMLDKIDALCADRDRMKAEAKQGRTYASGKRIHETPAHRRM
jgi:hypothetical protein